VQGQDQPLERTFRVHMGGCFGHGKASGRVGALYAARPSAASTERQVSRTFASDWNTRLANRQHQFLTGLEPARVGFELRVEIDDLKVSCAVAELIDGDGPQRLALPDLVCDGLCLGALCAFSFTRLRLGL